MKPSMIVGIIVIVIGIVAVGHRTFTYTSEETVMKLGPMEATVETQESFTVPLWAGIGLIIVGGLITLVGRR